MTTGKTIAFTMWAFVSKVITLLLNMLSRELVGVCNYIVFVNIESGSDQGQKLMPAGSSNQEGAR